MARQFGGKYSPSGKDRPAGGKTPTGSTAPAGPDGGARFRGRRAHNVNVAARALFAAPILLLFAGMAEVFSGNPLGAAIELGAFALLIIGAVMLNEGLKAEAAFDNRTIAKPPAVPRKALAALLAGLGVALAWATNGAGGLFAGIAFGGMATAAHLAAFGLDPMKRKGFDGTNSFDSERAARAIDAAEVTVAEILTAAREIGDRHLEGRVERMVSHARDMFRAIEEDPRDLTRARRFLGVYLTGARDATRKFAALYTRRQDAEARSDFVALLDDLEASFRHQREALLDDDKVALDIEIDVLRERLQREGI